MFGFLNEAVAQFFSNGLDQPLPEQPPLTSADYEALAPFGLGSDENIKETKKRTRREIYTKWEEMSRFAPLAEALNIHSSAALGGDATTGQQVFITLASKLRADESELSPFLKKQRERLLARTKSLESLVNTNVFKIFHDGITFGDAYVRVWGTEKQGLTHLLCDEKIKAPLIQSFEQAGRTIGYHVLDSSNYTRLVTELHPYQLLRFKMPRIVDVPQIDLLTNQESLAILKEDDVEKTPVYPSKVGGSFLASIESAYDNVILGLSTLNSQQIADAVQHVFMQMNMEGMTKAQRKKYLSAFSSILKEHEEFTKSALNGGEAVWRAKYGVLPTFGDKQIFTSLGDIKGQRQAPINTEVFMISVRLMMGGIGLDPSLVGWSDMLSGGLGDGAMFHTSAQIMLRSQRGRIALKEFVNELIALDWLYAYGEKFSTPLDYPWNVEFYSDQSAAMTEQLNNQNSRIQSALLKASLIAELKGLTLSVEVMTDHLEHDGGFDFDQAEAIAQDIYAQRENGVENG